MKTKGFGMEGNVAARLPLGLDFDQPFFSVRFQINPIKAVPSLQIFEREPQSSFVKPLFFIRSIALCPGPAEKARE